MDEFKLLTDQTPILNTGLLSDIYATYDELVAILGLPNCIDAVRNITPFPEYTQFYKVSTEWSFYWNGDIFRIYDYKATNLYDNKDAPSVEEFRQGLQWWHIGGHRKNLNDAFLLRRRLTELIVANRMEMSEIVKYLTQIHIGFEHPAQIWHLCNGCSHDFAECEGHPIFMCDLYEVPPPNNDAVIICDKFKNKEAN